MDAAKDGLEHDEDDGEDNEQELIALVFQYFLFPYMSQLLLLGKFEYGGGPIFKVVLEC